MPRRRNHLEHGWQACRDYARGAVRPETPGVLLDLHEYIMSEGKVSNAELGDVGQVNFFFSVPAVWGPTVG